MKYLLIVLLLLSASSSRAQYHPGSPSLAKTEQLLDSLNVLLSKQISLTESTSVVSKSNLVNTERLLKVSENNLQLVDRLVKLGESSQASTDKMEKLTWFLVGVAMLQLIVAWKQWRTATIQKRIALFEKRFSIYDVVRTSLSNAYQQGTSDLPNLSSGTTETEFFFNDNICKEVKIIKAKLKELNVINHELDDSSCLLEPEFEKRKKGEQEKIMSWIEEIPKLKTKTLFYRYFDFRKP